MAAQEEMMGKFIDLTGQKFGKWTVLKRAINNTKWGLPMWLCQCDCGRERIVQGGNLRSGESKGCVSCHISRMNTKHGLSRTKIYNVWKDMINRCENLNNKYYKNYGGRGISVYSEWRENFMAFKKWILANGYKKGLVIDRIDNDGDYEPENCRWATPKEQQRNRSNNRLIKIGNKIKPICEWAEQAGIHHNTLWNRIKVGWPEDKLLKPVEPKVA